MHPFIQKIRNLAQSDLQRIALPETQDERILEAAMMLDQSGIAKIILLGESDKINARLSRLGCVDHNMTIVNPLVDEQKEQLAQSFYQLRKHKGLTLEEARDALKDRLYYANMMLREGLIDGTVAGATNTTAHTVRSALHCLGVQEGVRTVSSFFFMLKEGSPFGEEGVLLFSDCGVMIEPTPVQLCDITVSSAKSWSAFCTAKPKAALLSFSTKGSAKHTRIDKTLEALSYLQERHPQLAVDGELQLDAALIPSVGERKAPDSQVAGQANILIFPNLEAGNIGYKIAERLGGYTALGPILQGLAYASNDLSRGCKATDIIDTVAITAVQAQQLKAKATQ